MDTESESAVPGDAGPERNTSPGPCWSGISHLIRGGLAGGAIGLWTGVWPIGFLLLLSNGLVWPGVDPPPELTELLRVSPEAAIAAAASRFNLDLPTHPIGFVAALVGVCAALGILLASFARLVRLDPGSAARDSYVWALRSITHRPSLVLCLGSAAILTALLVADVEAPAIVAFFVAVILSRMVIPILVCRPVVVATTPASNWWRPEWPGLTVVGVFFGLELLAIVSAILDFVVPSRLVPVSVLAFLVWFTISSLIPLLQAGWLLGASSHQEVNLRSLLSWRTLGPWLALGFWMILVPILCIGPVSVPYLWLWKIVPPLASYLESQGAALPYVYSLGVAVMRIIGQFWWALWMIPGSLFFWFASAKLVATTGDPA